MPEAIVFAAADVALDAGLIDAGTIGFLEGTTLGIGNATAIGTAAFTAVAIGLQYALSRSAAPSAEQGSQATQQPLQPRVRGWGDNRLGGAIMLFEAANNNAFVAAAFHQGPIDSISRVYFHSDNVILLTDITHGGISSVSGPGGCYGFAQINVMLGSAGTDGGFFTLDGDISGQWTSAFVGTDIAYWQLKCSAPSDPAQFQTMFPRELPQVSIVAKLAPVWDPRDPTQDRNDPSTWKQSVNPVLLLINFLMVSDGGMGLDIDEFLPAARLAQWMAEADLCDDDLGAGDIRYRCAGNYTFDTNPEDVINKLLATCDGWMAPAGDGTLALTIGVYREPTLPPLTEDDIQDCEVDTGIVDENLVNQIDVTFTFPGADYSTIQYASYRDQASISLRGTVKPKRLDLPWVQWQNQPGRLGLRALARANPKRSGTIITRDIGIWYAGERWIRLQYPFPGLEDCVIEVQDYQADILGGTVTIKFITVDQTDELLREDETPYLREDGTDYLREAA